MKTIELSDAELLALINILESYSGPEGDMADLIYQKVARLA